MGIKSTLPERTFEFSVRIVKLCLYIRKNNSELKPLVNQLIRSGTSIGANIEEGQSGQSKADFLSKYQIALKEARETKYWLKLLVATDNTLESRLHNILVECDEIMKIIASSVITGKSRKPK